tara:strand:+ start:84 stop:866 length:783 start_codon:yes stop_codon:yes gene_type:complete
VITLDFYQVDSFTNKLFRGNPAGVIFNSELSDSQMQKIALENNLSETAFIESKDNGFFIKWFSPLMEIDLCGHATLAAAHIYFTEIDTKANKINFNSKSGILNVYKDDDFLYLDFPSDNIKKIDIDESLIEMIGEKPIEAFKGRDDLMCIFNDELSIKSMNPNLDILKTYPVRGLIISAESADYDFISRCFFPITGVDEDPVTGSAHTSLTPYWCNKLNKDTLFAKQVSARGGEIKCRLDGDRVILGGQAVTYMKGTIVI